MLSHMHPQLAEFFHYRLAQQELMKELGESGAALSMQQDLRALRGWYKLFGQRVVHGDHDGLRGMCQATADAIVRVQITHAPAAAVEVDEGRGAVVWVGAGSGAAGMMRVCCDGLRR